jgi:dolichol kinase
MMLKKEEQFRPTGTTSLLLASLVVFSLFEKHIAITALLFVAVGDLAASIIGQKYGKHRFLKKTLEGSLACLVACLLVGMVTAGLSDTVNLTMAVYGAFCATIIEMLPIPADDNFTMPLFSAGTMALVALYM